MDSDRFQISAIEPQKKNPARVSIFLNGAFAFGLDREVMLLHNLHPGDYLTDEMIDDVLLAEERSKAKEKVLAWLSFRDRSVHEIRTRLNERGFSERTSLRVIDDLLRVGLLDDLRFAETWVRSRLIQRPASQRLIQRELEQKGIHKELAQEVTEAAFEEENEVDIAFSLIQRKLQRLDVSNPKDKKKLADFLLRRGFNWDVIHEALSRAR